MLLHQSTCISSLFNLYFFTIQRVFVTILRTFFQQHTCTSSEFQLYFFIVLHVFLYYSTVFQYHPMRIPSPFYVHFFSNLRVLLPNFNCISSLSCMYFFTILLYFNTTLCVFPHHSTYFYSIRIPSPFYVLLFYRYSLTILRTFILYVFPHHSTYFYSMRIPSPFYVLLFYRHSLTILRYLGDGFIPLVFLHHSTSNSSLSYVY